EPDAVTGVDPEAASVATGDDGAAGPVATSVVETVVGVVATSAAAGPTCASTVGACTSGGEADAPSAGGATPSPDGGDGPTDELSAFASLLVVDSGTLASRRTDGRADVVGPVGVTTSSVA